MKKDSKDLILPAKLTLKAHGKQVVFSKNIGEHSYHVFMKAFLWAIYLPQYPDIIIEYPIGDKYKPDLIALDENNKPVFWGESGRVSPEKITSIAKRYKNTHIAIAKWNTNLNHFSKIVEKAIKGINRNAHFDLINFETDSFEKFVDENRNINIRLEDLEFIRY